MSEIVKKTQNKYLIKKQGKMLTDCTLFLNENLFNKLEKEAIVQIKNVACLPGIEGNALAMPDMHSGYGFPIGGVAAFNMETGVVSPGGIGYDINCGVRLLTSNVELKEIKNNLKEILDKLFKNIPSGVGYENKDKLSKEELFELNIDGIDYAIKTGFANKKDKDCIEDYGKLQASNDYLSQKAISRALKQLGTLGSGNHFLEVQVIDEIYDKDLAKKWNLKKGNIAIMVHSGSRAFGHQVATDFVELFNNLDKKYKLNFPDKQLACVPIQSKDGQEYLSSMNAAANYAYVNRQLMTFKIREVFEDYGVKLNLLYDVAHNIAKKESYKIDGKLKEVLVHRKGATRAFSKGNNLLPEKYFKTGQPIILPGSMGTYSYVLVGDKAEKLSFGSVSHGSGRIISRSNAKNSLSYDSVIKDLHNKNILVKTNSLKGLVEEAPQTYKDVNEVVKILEKNKLARAIVRLKPIMVMKG
jgi:tRNA-splicing ligase RtcB